MPRNQEEWKKNLSIASRKRFDSMDETEKKRLTEAARKASDERWQKMNKKKRAEIGRSLAQKRWQKKVIPLSIFSKDQETKQSLPKH